MTRREENAGQIILPGMVEPEVLDLTRQQTFAHMAQPQFWGVEPRDLTAEDHSAIRLLDSERLLSSLVGVPPRSTTAAAYPEVNTGRLLRIALTPAEFSIITHSPWHLGERAVNKTRAAQPVTPSTDHVAAEAKSQRSGMHALEGRAERMKVYVTQLEADRSKLQHFSEYVSHPNFCRLRGDAFKDQMGWLRHHVFKSILDTLDVQRSWTPEKRALAERAMDDRLFLDRSHNRHLANWQDSFSLAQLYWGHKWALFKTKIHEAEQQADIYRRAAGQ